MYKQLLTGFCLLIACSMQAQVLFTYGKHAVTKKEFLEAFEKNPSADTTTRQDALRSYLQLYINYKLKVAAAKAGHLDETDQYRGETEAFKRELAEAAMNKEAGLENLTREAFLRSQTDLNISHIFVPVAAGADTLSAFRKIHDAYAQLQEGKSFPDVANEYSFAKNNEGNIGYITVFTLPYAAENLVYQLQPGGYAKPWRSAAGYHIFRLNEVRRAAGTRGIQALLFATPPGASASQTAAAQKLADSVYALLQSGASFTQMQALYGAGHNEVIEVNVGRYSPEFENAVFALQKEGEVSKPFLTSYGVNIVKLVEKKYSLPDSTDLTVKAEMQQKVAADERLTLAKEQWLPIWQKRSGYHPSSVNKKALWQFTDSAILSGKMPASVNGISAKTVLLSFAKGTQTANDWIRFLQMKTGEGKLVTAAAYADLMQQFVDYAVTDYYEQHIEEFDAELKAQINDFNDANLLFSAMDKHVWSKAADSTALLIKYYDEHRNRYLWAPGAEAVMVHATSQSLSDEIAAKIKAAPESWQSIVDSYGSLAQADSARYESSQLPVSNDTRLESGMLLRSEQPLAEEVFSFAYIFKVHANAEPRSFDEAKGSVINDYQQVIENNWIAELRKKYPVVINESVFNSIQ